MTLTQRRPTLIPNYEANERRWFNATSASAQTAQECLDVLRIRRD